MRIFKKGFQNICTTSTTGTSSSRAGSSAGSTSKSKIPHQFGLNVDYLKQVEADLPIFQIIQNTVAEISTHVCNQKNNNVKLLNQVIIVAL
jgi:hypothetical protein